MPRAEAGTAKYLANAMKAKGLQKLRWYCQVCEKQCRDENGFKCHMATEAHLRQMLVVGEHAGKHISDFSSQFQYEFVQLLSRRFGTKRVKANTVYQEYIQDRHHLHMNSTRWVTLTEFAKHLGRSGICRVDETEKGWFIAWIDNSPKALAKAEAAEKKERATTSDEQRERALIAEQIARAAEAAEAAESSNASASASEEVTIGLQREEGSAPIKLAFGLKKDSSEASSSEAGPSSSPALSGPKPAGITLSKTNPLKMATKPSNPLKGNVFKSASKAGAVGTKRDREDSAVQKLSGGNPDTKRLKMDGGNTST